MKKKWNLYNISESRGITMGIATLLVAYFHCYKLNYTAAFNGNVFGIILDFIRGTGNVGVDLFLILSALGLYFSFSKNSDIKSFYKKRMIRILPSVLIVAIIYYLYLKVNFISFIKGILLINIFTDGIRYFWYFSLIIILYLLFPLLYKIINKKGLFGLIGLLLVVVGSTILFYIYFPNAYKNVEILITRIPVFLCGIYLGKNIFEKKEIPSWVLIPIIAIFIFVLYILNNYKFEHYMIVRYLNMFVGFGIVFITSFIYSLFKVDFINKFLTYIGTYSMELYLIFEKLSVEVIKARIINIKNYTLYYLIMFIISLLLSILLKKICEVIVNLIERKKA